MTEPKPIERIDAALDRIARDQTNAFTTVFANDARARAIALEQSDHHGPLYGLPVAVKDLFDIAAVPTTGACAAYASRVATEDADLVTLLREAGAVIVGKTNLHELGFGATGLISAAGPVRNPLDPNVLPGGSSSGSAAAVAAGHVPLAIGTDTGGSIRMPASFCGIVGLKPTPGSISLTGAMAMSPALDCAGPMAATVRECATAWEVLSARPDPGAFPPVPPPHHLSCGSGYHPRSSSGSTPRPGWPWNRRRASLRRPQPRSLRFRKSNAWKAPRGSTSCGPTPRSTTATSMRAISDYIPRWLPCCAWAGR